MKTIIVTGTSTGIGFAAAVALARAGHDVFATMRDPARSPELQALVTKENLSITIVPLDVDSDASVSRGMAKIQEMRGRVDVLVNNAGIGQLGSVEETPLDQFRQVMETNFFGALRCIQAVSRACARGKAAASSTSRRWLASWRQRVNPRIAHRSSHSRPSASRSLQKCGLSTFASPSLSRV